MEVNTQESVSSSESTQTAAVTASEPVQAPASTNATELSSASTEAAAANPYTPNYKFKVMDKEMEFDPIVRSAIKSAEDEKKIRELYEKAHGLDAVKQAREQIKSEYNQYKEQNAPMQAQVADATKSYQRSMEAIKKGDQKSFTFHFGNVLQTMGIPKQTVQQWVFNELQMEDASPEQKNEYNRQRELESNYLGTQERLAQMELQNQDLQRQQKTFELNSALSKSDTASVQQSFDQRNGEGSFKREIIQRGYIKQQLEQRNVSADEVINEMIKAYGLQAQAMQSAQAPTPVVPHAPPVIPAVKGSAGSPASRVPQSLDELRKLAQEQT